MINTFKENWVSLFQQWQIAKSILGNVLTPPPCAGVRSGVSYRRLFMVSQSLRLHVCSFHSVYGECFLHVFIHFSQAVNLAVFVLSFTKIPDLWEESIGCRCPIYVWTFWSLLLSAHCPTVNCCVCDYLFENRLLWL